MTVAEAWQQLAESLEPLADVIDDLQVTGYLNSNPTPPSLDVYPGDPFQRGSGFGIGSKEAFFTVRARVSTADQQAGQQLLVRMLDVQDAASVEAAIDAADAGTVVDEGVTGFREYLEEAAANGRLLGCEWRVEVYL